MDNLKKLPGFRDLAQGTRLNLNRAYTVLSDIFSSYGYDAIDTPFLEPTEMFLRKGGGEMASQIYSFVDPGGNPVSLRPEFTSSILRWCLEEARLDRLPLRVQYGGPVFRYRRQGDEYRQFHQAGVELIGSADPRADAEALMLACQGLSALGVEDLKLVLGDLGVYNRIALQMSLSERARVFLLDNVSRLRDGADGLQAVSDRAAKFRLMSDGNSSNGIMAQLVGLKEAEARSLIAGMIEREDPTVLGQRTAEEVAERLLRKARGAGEQSKMHFALSVASRLAAIQGPAGPALASAEDLLRSEAVDVQALDPLTRVVTLLENTDLGGAEITVDLGMARGIAYYTGIVFELLDGNSGLSLGGGGRYDGLARNMGSPRDVPALGFAYDLDRLLDGIAKHLSGADSPTETPRLLVVPAAPDAYDTALRQAQALREEGSGIVEMEVCGRSPEQAAAYAAARGIDSIVLVSSTGEREELPVDPL